MFASELETVDADVREGASDGTFSDRSGRGSAVVIVVVARRIKRVRRVEVVKVVSCIVVACFLLFCEKESSCDDLCVLRVFYS
jgi:hypothetical protein